MFHLSILWVRLTWLCMGFVTVWNLLRNFILVAYSQVSDPYAMQCKLGGMTQPGSMKLLVLSFCKLPLEFFLVHCCSLEIFLRVISTFRFRNWQSDNNISLSVSLGALFTSNLGFFCISTAIFYSRLMLPDQPFLKEAQIRSRLGTSKAQRCQWKIHQRPL